jgi:hypothetical protein
VLGKTAAQLGARLEKKRKRADREVDGSTLSAENPPPPVSDKALRALRAAVEKVLSQRDVVAMWQDVKRVKQ